MKQIFMYMYILKFVYYMIKNGWVGNCFDWIGI